MLFRKSKNQPRITRIGYKLQSERFRREGDVFIGEHPDHRSADQWIREMQSKGFKVSR